VSALVPSPAVRSEADELATIRAGRADSATVARWMERARRLAAPEAPADGDLAPNGTGWMLTAGTLEQRIRPRLEWWARRSAILAPIYPAFRELLGIPRLGSPIGPLLAGAIGMTPFLLFWQLSTRLTRRKIARWFEAASAPGLLADVPTGTVVRVTGVIARQPTVPTLFRDAPAVLFRNRVGAADETRGIDFHLRLDDGQPVGIGVRRALLLDPPTRVHEPPACGPVFPVSELFLRPRLRSTLLDPPSFLARLFGRPRYHESSVGPDDRIEVCGVLHREPAREVMPFTRKAPIDHVVRAGEEMPLLVRRA
jgi:hypothetical protein